MEPTQVALQLGTWVGVANGHAEGMLALRTDVAFSHRVGAAVSLGMQRRSDGAISARDTTVVAVWIPVSTDTLTVRLQPGLSIPTGGLGQGLLFTPLSTSSVDPYLGVDATYGAAWLGALSAVVRAPLYPGWDLRTQGPFARLDLRIARRLKGWLPAIGLSAARQAPSVPAGAAPDFGDIAATAGATINLSKRSSMGAIVRIPLWVTEGSLRVPAGGLSVRTVVGSPPDDHHH